MSKEGCRVTKSRPALRLEGITKRFPNVVANDGVTIEVRRGEILGLLGENGAGKTTLMRIVYGLIQPDEGRIEVDGKAVKIRSPRDALSLGIGMVHQHFMLVPDMTVAENVALSLSAGKLRLSRLNEVRNRISELSDRFGLAVHPDDVIENASVGVQQRVEILKLLYRGAEILILDEPTSVLTPPEWRDLSGVLKSLVSKGTAIVFITHKLDELVGVADRCTVLRDGRVVGTTELAHTNKAELARMMVGREVTLRVERPPLQPGRPILEVEELTMVENGRTLLDRITFAVREREILGIAGVEGNGQHELVEALIGVRRPTAGVIRMNGKVLDRLDPREFVRNLGGVITEDRHRAGVALELSLLSNLMMKDFFSPPFSRHGILDYRRAERHCRELMSHYDIRAPGLETPMRLLSGGNQQKAVLAREIHRRPRLLIAAQPTRGLDISAAEFVYRQLLEHRQAGCAIFLISVELDEILSLSDRIVVMYGGRFLRILESGEADPERLGLLMAGQEVAT